jgi:hypothetical protein
MPEYCLGKAGGLGSEVGSRLDSAGNAICSTLGPGDGATFLALAVPRDLFLDGGTPPTINLPLIAPTSLFP